MAKITCPNIQYTGVSASVSFVKGEGETDDPKLIAWFKAHGYKVVESKQTSNGTADESKTDASESNGTGTETDEESGNEEITIDQIRAMSVEELKAYAEEHNIDIGKATSEDGIEKKILTALMV